MKTFLSQATPFVLLALLISTLLWAGLDEWKSTYASVKQSEEAPPTIPTDGEPAEEYEEHTQRLIAGRDGRILDAEAGTWIVNPGGLVIGSNGFVRVDSREVIYLGPMGRHPRAAESNEADNTAQAAFEPKNSGTIIGPGEAGFRIKADGNITVRIQDIDLETGSCIYTFETAADTE